METFFSLMQVNMYVNYVLRELVISLYCFRIDYGDVHIALGRAQERKQFSPLS